MTAFVLPFEEIGSSDLAKVGGKGANLGELTRAGFNVPAGFCVSTSAYTHFIAAADVEPFTRLEEIQANDLEQLRHIAHAVRTDLESVPLPEMIVDSVIMAWRKFGEEHAYAVRSSATAEDLPHASFAGQQDTYLNIIGQEALLANVKACFISLFTDRAVLYRIQNGFDHRQVALSVVVQRMVQPEVSGILFTADPITGDRNTVSIDASFGLGEALVSGLVSADLYQVDKRENQIVKRQIATKKLAIRSLADGGTEQVDLKESEGTQAALTDAQVLALANLGRAVEAHYDTPQDIEWALVDERLYITQSRPITSLYPLPEPKPTDDAMHLYFSMSHLQVMIDAMPPLALSVLRALIPIGRVDGQLESRYIHRAGGRFYADLSPILRHPVGRRLLLRGFKNMDQLAVAALALLAERPSFQSHGERFNPFRLLPAARPYFLRMVRMLLWGSPEGVPATASSLIDDHIAEVKAKLDNAGDLREKLDIILFEIQNASKPILTWAPYLVAGVMATVLLKRLLRKRGVADDIAALERGLIGNVATEMNLAVGDLADAARASKALETYMGQTEIDAATRLAGVAALPSGDGFLQLWNDFICTYGARGPSEIDISRPRWSEDPASLLQMVVNIMGHSEAGAHRVHYQKLTDEGEKAMTTLGTVAQTGWLGWLRGPLVKRLIRVSRNLTPLREHHKFFAIQLLGIAKAVFIEAGKQFHDEGQLESADDIWFLTLPELLEAVKAPAIERKQRVAARRGDFEHYQQLIPPRVITSEGEIPIVKFDGVEAPDGALIGSPVSAGVTEGIAKVVLDPSTEALEPGEILVAPFTDPGWTPLFVNAAGLITEVGGLMTHGSVVAREYGIPAVVGVLDATKQIKTGQRVRVHGDAGYIELLHGDIPETEVEPV